MLLAGQFTNLIFGGDCTTTFMSGFPISAQPRVVLVPWPPPATDNCPHPDGAGLPWCAVSIHSSLHQSPSFFSSFLLADHFSVRGLAPHVVHIWDLGWQLDFLYALDTLHDPLCIMFLLIFSLFQFFSAQTIFREKTLRFPPPNNYSEMFNDFLPFMLCLFLDLSMT